MTTPSTPLQRRQKLRGGAIVLSVIVLIAFIWGARSSSQSTPTKDDRRIAMETAACTASLAGTTRYIGYGCYEYCNGKQREKKDGCSDSPDNSQDRSGQSCVGLPDNAQRNGADNIDQVWDGSKRYPTTTGRYNEGVSDGECTFSCQGGYDWDGNNCIPSGSCLFTPGITHDTITQTITIANCNNSYTIMDRNLGATKAGTGKIYGENCSSTIDGTCIDESAGYYFQRGNNYGFPNNGIINSTSSDLVDASSYGPTNPYSSGTLILQTIRDSSSNGDLRGGSGDSVTNGRDTDNLRTDRQGPCPSGYHVPSVGEWGGLIAARNDANPSHEGEYDDSDGLSAIQEWTESDFVKFQADTKLPLVGRLNVFSLLYIDHQGKLGLYWSSSPYSDGFAVHTLYLNSLYPNWSYSVSSKGLDDRGYGFPVRCFKD